MSGRPGKLACARHPRLESGIKKHERPIDGDVVHAAHESEERGAIENRFAKLGLDVQKGHLSDDIERTKCGIVDAA
jgi:hypothetical protein